MESILTSIKKMLGITAEYKHFDQDIIIHINTIFATLTQLGVGPAEGFSIKDEEATWTDFVPESPKLEPIKSFIFLKVRLLFDPPASSVVVDAMNRSINELEWRISVTVDPGELEENQNG